MAAGSVWSSLGCRQRGVNAAAGIDLRHCYRAPRDRKFATRPRRFGDPEGIWPYSDPGLASSIAQKGGPCLLMQRVVASIRYRSGLVAAAVLPEAVYSALIVMQRHRANIGVFPNIVRPKTYNEKVLHRMLFDRRPILTQLQDKYAVRAYVKDILGEDTLPRLYWVGTNPVEMPFDDFPNRFVVKPTHGSGWYRLISDKVAVDRHELIEQCKFWLSQNYYYVGREWVYKNIVPRILVEEYINDGTGPDPIRYKVLIFHGNAQVITAEVGVPGQASYGFYGRSWERLAGFYPRWKVIGDLVAPKHLAELIRYAEILAGGLDFIRVDLFDTETKVYVGELTTCPGGGTTPFSPSEFDRELGALWNP